MQLTNLNRVLLQTCSQQHRNSSVFPCTVLLQKTYWEKKKKGKGKEKENPTSTPLNVRENI